MEKSYSIFVQMLNNEKMFKKCGCSSYSKFITNNVGSRNSRNTFSYTSTSNTCISIQIIY